MTGRPIPALVLALLLGACDGSGIVVGDARVDPDAVLPDADAGDPCESYTDSDGDTIPDIIEGDWDFDGDTIPNFFDDDSDGDTIPDSVEAGDDDLCTHPENSDWDRDEIPDFLDSDSDSDGLPDAVEREMGTDPTDFDTDRDGYPDQCEVVLGSDPLDRESRPGPGVIFIDLPYMAEEHERLTLTFDIEHRQVDVYFLVDTNLSMRDSIEWLDALFSTNVVPALRSEVPDVEMGVGHFNDVPSGEYGSGESQPFRNVQTITGEDSLVHDALALLHGPDFPFGGYSDPPESQVIALACAASGDGFTDCGSAVPPGSCPADHPGYPCFRPGSLPVIAMISDADWHVDDLGLNAYDCTGAGFDTALESMLDIGARFIGVHVGTEEDRGFGSMSAMAVATGSVDATGEGLVSAEDPSTVSTAIADLFLTLASSNPMDVNACPLDADDDPVEEYDATVFLKDVTPLSGRPPAPEGFSSMDGTFFYDVVPGTSLAFDLDFYNDTVPAAEHMQFFKLRILVLGNGREVRSRVVFAVTVPAREGGMVPGP